MGILLSSLVQFLILPLLLLDFLFRLFIVILFHNRLHFQEINRHTYSNDHKIHLLITAHSAKNAIINSLVMVLDNTDGLISILMLRLDSATLA